MNIENSNLTHVPERAETDMQPASYEQYRLMCDDLSNSYRRIGIMDPESYEAATKDPTTELVEYGSELIPFIVSSDHISGFDVERSKRLTGKTDLYVLSAPVELLVGHVDLKGDYTDAAIIVESDASITDSSKDAAIGVLRSQDGIFNVGEFVDQRIAETDHKTAWLAMYEGEVTVLNKSPEKKTLEQAFFDDGGEIAPENGYTLLSGPSLAQHPEIIDQMWELFCDRFGWLGDFHPVSMEDTREWFDEFLTHEETNTLIRYVDGEPKCAGFYQMDARNCEWINQNHPAVANSTKEGSRVFLVALAATADGLGNYAEDYVKFQCRIGAMAGIDYSVLIESSNMSSLYIPRIMEAYMSSSGYADVEISQTAKQDYWYITL